MINTLQPSAILLLTVTRAVGLSAHVSNRNLKALLKLLSRGSPCRLSGGRTSWHHVVNLLYGCVTLTRTLALILIPF